MSEGLQLQRTVEAISEWQLHEPNLPCLAGTAAPVEPTGTVPRQTGGPMTALSCFRREVQERPAPGLGVRTRRWSEE